MLRASESLSSPTRPAKVVGRPPTVARTCARYSPLVFLELKSTRICEEMTTP